MKRPHLRALPRLGPAWPLGLALLALAALGCAGVASPQGWASPAATDGLVLVSHKDELFALEAESLAPAWAFPPSGDDDIDAEALYGTPAVSEERVYVPTYDGTLYALDLETGEVDWEFETDGPLVGGVALGDGAVYFGSEDSHVYALDTESGDLLWDFDTGERVWSKPAVQGSVVYITSLDQRLYAVDASNGDELWRFKTGAGIASPPVVNEEEGLVYVGGFDQRLRAIDIETHEERWSVKAGNWFWTEPLVHDGTVYAGSLDGKVYAVDAATGAERWLRPFPAGDEVRAAPVFAADRVVVVSRRGLVYGIEPEDGSARQPGALDLESDVFADPLVIALEEEGGAAAGEVLIVTRDGELVRVDPEEISLIARRPLG